MMFSVVLKTYQVLTEKKKKKQCNIFKSNGLSISIECNLTVTDFLELTFDLSV